MLEFDQDIFYINSGHSWMICSTENDEAILGVALNSVRTAPLQQTWKEWVLDKFFACAKYSGFESLSAWYGVYGYQDRKLGLF